uniref:Replication protein A 28 kDa subunit n=1 Tax=Lygus hesperus TaxID=30085 RepID=A0A0A9Y294_LYGHE
MPLPRMTHVRASGTVKVWKETPIITGTVLAVADSNELNYHAMDAILTHLRLTKGDVSANKNDAKSMEGLSFVNNANAVGVHNMLPGGDSKVLLTDLLVNAIKQFGQRDNGMSMDELAQHASRYNFNANDVRIAMRTLAAEGRVYQTHDNRFNV